MREQHQNLFDWRSTLGTLAISLGMFSVAQLPARAIPMSSQTNFKLAQVGVRSRMNGPTPLNLRPRTHIPLPRVNRHYGSYYRYPRYGDRYYDGSRYGHDYHHTYHRRNRHKRGSVIIINPSNYTEYSNYDYIHIIRK